MSENDKEGKQKLFVDFTTPVISCGEFFTDVAAPLRDKAKEISKNIEESISKIPENEDLVTMELKLQLQEMQMVIEKMIENLQLSFDDAKIIIKGCLTMSEKINLCLTEEEAE